LILYNFDGVVKSPIYCALVPDQTFDVPYVLLQAWPITKACIWNLSIAISILFTRASILFKTNALNILNRILTKIKKMGFIQNETN